MFVLHTIQSSLVTLVGFSWGVNFIPISIPYVSDGVDLIPGYLCLNSQNTPYINLIGIGMLLMCFLTNEIKETFIGGSGTLLSLCKIAA